MPLRAAAPRIDTTFDVRTDTPPGRDPDTYSPTLRRYHRILWSKELPDGRFFGLDPERGAYLVHRSDLGVFKLSSDTITTRLLGRAASVIREIPPDRLPLYRGYTIGSSLIFPATKVGGGATINGARGMHPRIADRIDLTLECIRRHYLGGRSPLSAVLSRYQGFFDLFGTFTGYAEFFLLQDLLDDSGRGLRFFLVFDDFTGPAVPRTVDEYLQYRQAVNRFITDRNLRIDQYTKA